MVSALSKGDEVVTSSGILGKVTSLDDNYMVLNVANNVEMKFQRVHVHAVLPKGTLKSIGCTGWHLDYPTQDRPGPNANPPAVPRARLRAMGRGHRLWVKRDDLTGCTLSGNKVRKLEFITAHAMDNGYDTLITCGGFRAITAVPRLLPVPSWDCRFTCCCGARSQRSQRATCYWITWPAPASTAIPSSSM